MSPGTMATGLASTGLASTGLASTRLANTGPPDGAVIDDGNARRIGRCRVSDWTRLSADGGRRIVLTGEMRHAEVRVHRDGVAILSAMCSRAYLADALRARREGRYPTIDDPTR
jgi:hypothetical protein